MLAVSCSENTHNPLRRQMGPVSACVLKCILLWRAQHTFFSGKPRSLAVDAAAAKDAQEFEIDENKIGKIRWMFLKLGGAQTGLCSRFLSHTPHESPCRHD